MHPSPPALDRELPALIESALCFRPSMAAGDLGLGPADKARRGAVVKNTFLEFQDDGQEEGGDDPWLVTPGVRRQQTDSVVERSSQSLRFDLEQNIVAELRRQLGGASSSSPGAATAKLGVQAAAAKLAPVTVEAKDLATAPTPKLAMPSAPVPKGGASVTQEPIPASMPKPSMCLPPPGAAEGGANSPQAWKRPGQPPLAHPFATAAGRQKTPEDEPEPAPPVSGSANSMSESSEGSEAEDALPLLPSKLFTGLADACNGEAAAARTDAPAVPNNDVSCLAGCTTVMVRNIPCKYTQRKLMREINSTGFLGRYDFLYLPMDPRRRANRGFAFLNLDSPEIAASFFELFNGKMLRHFSAEKPIEVVAADIQGFEANAEHYLSARAVRRNRDSHSRPLFLRNVTGEGAAGLQQLQQLQQLQHLQHLQQVSPAAATPASCAVSSSVAQLQRQLQAQLQLAGAAQQAPQPPRAQPHRPQLPGVQAQPEAGVLPRFCAYCGQPKKAEHLFCPYCGIQAPQPVPQQVPQQAPQLPQQSQWLQPPQQAGAQPQGQSDGMDLLLAGGLMTF